MTGTPRSANIFRSIGLAIVAGASLITVAISGPALAQSDGLVNRLERLERDIQTLQRMVYRGETPPADAGDPGSVATEMPSGAATRFDARISQLEQQLQSLTGQVEEVLFKVNQSQERLDRALPDFDVRLRDLEDARFANEQPASDAEPLATENAVRSSETSEGVLQRPSGAAQADTAAALPSDGSPQEKYDAAFTHLRNGDYDTAEAALTSFLSQHGEHDLAGNAQYWLGETYYVRGQFEQAAVAFLGGYQTYEKSSKAPDSLLKLGLSLAKLDKKSEACAAFGRLAEQFPKAPDSVKRRATSERQALACE